MSGAQRFHPVRGELIDIGGRRMRLVRAGRPSGRPTILCEHGAFGCAADWASVQSRLAAKGLYSLAYDRAGLGLSDPGPKPRDGRAIVADLEALLAHAGETGPFVLVGHSMGGLMVRLFAHADLERVKGVVLVDAVTPEALDMRFARQAVALFGGGLRLAGLGAKAGLMRPVARFSGNLIGLTGEAAIEKRRIYASAVHAKWAAEEVAQWPATSEMARAEPFAPNLPIAVITAGSEAQNPRLKGVQSLAAEASRHGYVEHVEGANHASLLGERFADPIVRGVEHVLKAARA
ncbi:alpha/beta fold hydrolase [Phenylobacterium sp.]|uniref:alpha/beta fold hydrolase n=1 Tax=Phenylobacterium sp. TaxID=1871053 RepID=UPI0035B25880